jgi:hypothetical protein
VESDSGNASAGVISSWRVNVFFSRTKTFLVRLRDFARFNGHSDGFRFSPALGAWGTYSGAPTIHNLSALHGARMADYVTSLGSLGIILVLMKQMETSVLRLRHLRVYVTAEVSAASLDAAIAEGEARIADVKRKLAPVIRQTT